MSSRRDFLEKLLGTTTVVFGSGIWNPAAKLFAPEPLVLASVPEEVFKRQAALGGEIDEAFKRYYLPKMRALMTGSGVLDETLSGVISIEDDPFTGEPEVRTTPAIGQGHAAARIAQRRKSTRRAKMAGLFAGGPEPAPGAIRT